MAEINNVIAEASQDLQTIEDFVNLPAGSDVRPRLLPSVNVGTLAGTRDAIFRAGGLPAEPFETLANMEADGASLADGQLAIVYNETANNGLYVKTAGAWVKSGYDPVGLSKLQAALLSSFGDWLTTDSKYSLASLDETSPRYLVARAVKKIAVLNPVDNTVYRISSVYKNSGSSGSRILISSPVGVVASIAIPSSEHVSGIKKYSIKGAASTGGINVELEIDWDTFPSSFAASTLNLEIDNSKYGDSYKNSESIKDITTDIDGLSTLLDSVVLPTWFSTTYAFKFQTLTDSQKSALQGILGIEIKGASPDTELKIATVAKNDPTHATKIMVTNAAGTIVSRYDAPNTTIKTGLENIVLKQVSGSGISLNVTVDWDTIPAGLPITGISDLVIDANAKNLASAKPLSEKNALDIAILQQGGGLSTSATIPSKPYKVSVAGSSITWGQGYLGESSYVGELENILRNQHATTMLASSIASAEATVTGSDFYRGEAKKISGLNKEVSFTLSGDELSLSLGLERENTGACDIELYVDGVLYDTFNTATKQSVSKSQSFTGDGVALKFDLDTAFTYGHVVKVAGVTKLGEINTQGSGGSIPASDDYMIVRRYDSVANKVVHTVWFKTAPTGAITVDYKYGENIRHLRGTIDRAGAGYDTALESPYGDGAISFDETAPSSLSSGFGFRQSDERSVKTWKFSDSKTRSFKLKIKTLHSIATGTTPYFILNFVTNRMHHIQNAGIGGWDASELLSHSVKLNTIDYVLDFNPDILLIESATNDDNSGAGMFKAHVVRTGVTAAEILAEPTANYFTSISGSVDDKTVHDVRIPITAVTKSTITLDASVVDTDISVGDAVVIGEYDGSHERTQVRTVRSYDSATKTITLNRFISADDFKQAETLDDLVGQKVYIYNAPVWKTAVNNLIDVVEANLPYCKISLATAGIPHFYRRRLFGYRELAEQIALERDVGFVDYYKATFDYQYTQVATTQQTISSTGASSYALTGSGYVYANPEVFVDGIEHKNFKVFGGLTLHWSSSITDPTLSNESSSTNPFKLVFEKDIPASGAVITVKKSTTVWANDYCHPTPPQGLFVLGRAASKILKDIN